METFLPFLFMGAAAVALLLSISFLWSSLRTLFGAEHELYVEQSGAVRRRMELLEEKDAVLKSLKDLEFERDVGKVSDEDFKRLDSEARQRAKRIMRALDDDLREHRDKAHKLVENELKQAAKSRAERAS
ncbi:MAG TPA: hypothetical protein VFZ61_06355 [Polyangiales bacterium]